jgi:hypothetical protein
MGPANIARAKHRASETLGFKYMNPSCKGENNPAPPLSYNNRPQISHPFRYEGMAAYKFCIIVERMDESVHTKAIHCCAKRHFKVYGAIIRKGNAVPQWKQKLAYHTSGSKVLSNGIT